MRKVLDLITAVAAGDATREDVAAAIRNEGVDSLDVLVEVLAQATKKKSKYDDCARPLDLQKNSTPRMAESQPPIVHKVPQLPFLMRGTLYDPGDIGRFDGQELHFIPAESNDCTLVIDDRAVIENWWQLSALTSNLTADFRLPLGPHLRDFPEPGIPDSPPTQGPEGYGYTGGPPPPPPNTTFYEDMNFQGSEIKLTPNHGYADLTQVSYTFFGTGDWNDTISSVSMYATHFAVLHEHIHWTGSTFTCVHGMGDLNPHGWNDRASSVETW